MKQKLVLLALLTCSPAYADVVIGVAGPMTGQNAAFGQQMMIGTQAAVDSINAQGGINGEQLALVQVDDGCDSRRAVAGAQELVAKDARFVVGHFCSGSAIAAAEVYAKADVIMLSPSASNQQLTEGNKWNVFRLASRDDTQADFAMARIARDKPDAKVMVVTDGSPLLNLIARRAKGMAQISVTPGAASYPQAVEAIRTSGANVVYMACGGAEAGTLAADLKDAGITVAIYGPDSLIVDTFWERSGEAGEGAMATFAADPMAVPQAQSAVAQFKAAGLDPQGMALPSYAAVEVFEAAAKAKSVNNGAAMADWLRSGAEIQTVLGPVHFDRKGDVEPQRFDWYRWSQGSYMREQSAN